MGTSQRINVASGRSLENLAHYSRALRAGNLVLQSGTTAIDRQGNVHGEGNIARQVEAIMSIAEWSMGQAGGTFADVVRSRIYITDMTLADQAMRTLARYFREVCPTGTLVQVNRLARPAQLIEIEFDAVDGAATQAQRISSGRPIESEYAYSRAVRVGEHIYISGTTALNAQGVVAGQGDLYRQTRQTLDTIFWALEQAGGRPEDLVYTKSFLTDLSRTAEYTRAWVEALGDVRPVATLLGVPGLISSDMLVEIEAEAIISAGKIRRDMYTARRREHPRGYARAVAVGDWVYVSGCTSLDDAGQPQAVGDWAAQVDLAHETIQWSLAQAGASLDDVIRRRTFTVDRAQINRPHGEGPAWFANSCPVSMGCRISGLAQPELLVEVEAVARKGAQADITWLGPAETDPLQG